MLRGDPDTPVRIKYARDDFGVPARTKAALSIEGTVRTAILDRRLVRLSDVKLATLLGDPGDFCRILNSTVVVVVVVVAAIFSTFAQPSPTCSNYRPIASHAQRTVSGTLT